MEEPEALGLNPKVDVYLELAGLASGLLLVAFLWVHAFLVATAVPGAAVFNGMARFLERYYISHAGIGLGLVIGLIHVISVARRIPTGYREQRSLWRLARKLQHTDTYTWTFQVVTGLIILVLAATHIWVVLADWPLAAAKSALRVQSNYFSFYIILLLIAEYHSGVGVYRQLVKWTRFRRRPAALAVGTAVGFILAVNLAALWALARLGVAR